MIYNLKFGNSDSFNTIKERVAFGQSEGLGGLH